MSRPGRSEQEQRRPTWSLRGVKRLQVGKAWGAPAAAGLGPAGQDGRPPDPEAGFGSGQLSVRSLRWVTLEARGEGQAGATEGTGRRGGPGLGRIGPQPQHVPSGCRLCAVGCRCQDSQRISQAKSLLSTAAPGEDGWKALAQRAQGGRASAIRSKSGGGNPLPRMAPPHALRPSRLDSLTEELRHAPPTTLRSLHLGAAQRRADSPMRELSDE